MPYLWASIVAGWVVLACAGDRLAPVWGRLAQRSGRRSVVPAVLIIAVSVSVPELVVTALCGARGQDDLAIAAVVGSNVMNLTLVLGIGGLIGALAARSWPLQHMTLLSVAAVIIFAILLLQGLGRGAAVTLGLALAGMLALLWHLSRSLPDDETRRRQPPHHEGRTLPLRTGRSAARIAAGWVGVSAGASLLAVGAAGVSGRTGTSADLAGFTVLAFGLALPELLLTLRAQRHGYGDLVVGILLSANVINSLAAGAIAALTTHRAPAVAPTAVVTMVAVSVSAGILLAIDTRLSRSQSALLVTAYGLLLLYV